MWFESDLLNILVVLVPVLFLMWLERPKEYTKEDYEKSAKHVEERNMERNADPRSYDPFYLSDNYKDFKKEVVERLRKKDTKEKIVK